jgi:PAS domain S-box-containing protein
MSPDPHSANGDAAGEIAALVATLHRTERRLEEVTRGEVDSVAFGSGRPFLLRRAQDELRQSEVDKQAAILNSLPANIALLDAQGVIVTVNETWRHFETANPLVGPQFGIGINYLEVCERARGIDSAQAQQAAAGIRSVLAGARNFSLEYPCNAPKEEHWFQMLVTPLCLMGARGAIVSHMDIAERKRIEARFRRLVDSDVQAVIFWNTRGEITDANQAFLRLTGYTREDVQGGRVNWAEMTPPEFAPLDRQALAEIAATGICAAYEKVWIRRDGSRVPILLGAAIFEDNRDEGVCFVLDLSQSKKAEEKSRESEKRFKALFEQAAVGVALADVVTGRFVHVNQRFADIVGRSRGEMEQLTFAAITHPHQPGSDLEMMHKLRAGAVREATWEKRYVRKDGAEVWANLTISAMWVAGETPSLCIAIMQDITERKLIEEQVRQVQKMDAIGTLAGGIAHDFNNILTAISGYTELAQMTLVENPGVRGHLGSVLQASKRAADLVRQILTFSRQQPLERKPVLLQTLVQETFHLLRATIPSTIEFDLKLAADAPQVLADETHVNGQL